MLWEYIANYSTPNMPAATTPPAQAATAAKPEKSEQMWSALKTHILRERQRKKQEQEAEVEEERLRKEREARERQDVMTLGETKEQIQQLETKLAQLKDEKHQLFLQLKKVLNEDDNRRRQLHKENDMLIHNIPPGMVHTQLFLPPVGGPAPPRQQHPHGIGQPQALIHKAPPQVIGGPMKRGRSPSPNNISGYYKQANTYAPPKLEEGRRPTEVGRAVLWNKPSQYTNNPPGTPFYQVPPPVSTDNRSPQMIYSNYAPVISQRPDTNIRQTQNYHLELKPDTGKSAQSVYHINIEQKPISDNQQRHLQPDRNYHIEIKHDERKITPQERGYMDKNLAAHGITVSAPSAADGMLYAPGMRQAQMPMHASIPIQNAAQNPKPGSITSGYPLRTPTGPQQNPGILYPRRY